MIASSVDLERDRVVLVRSDVLSCQFLLGIVEIAARTVILHLRF